MSRTASIADFIDAAGGDATRAIALAMSALPPGEPGRVWVPSGNWVCRSPVVFDRDRTELVGESPLAASLSFADYGPGIFSWRSASLPAARRVDGHNVLGSGLAPAPGRKWGLSVGVDSFTCVPSLPPTSGRGDWWREMPGLTFSLLVDLKTDPAVAPVSIFGLGDKEGPHPISLDAYYEPGLGRSAFRLRFATADRPRAPREILFGTATPGPTRVDFQMAFDRASASGAFIPLCDVRAWQDRKEVVVARGWGTDLPSASGDRPGFSPSCGVRFEPNRLASFKLGNGNFNDNVTQGKSGRYDLYGLSLACDAAFDSDAAGNQVRTDNRAPVDDPYRYEHAGRDPDALVARLLLDLVGSDPPCVVRFPSGSRTGTVSGMGFCFAEGPRPIEGVAIRDLAVYARDYCPAILAGPMVGLTLERVTAQHGSHGFCTLNCGATYDLVFKGCSLGGSAAWLQAVDAVVDCDGLARDMVPGVAVRLSGCDARLGPVRTGTDRGDDARVVEILDKTDYASQYEVAFVSPDQEEGPCLAAVHCEKAAGGTRLQLGVVGGGWRDGATPIVRLVDRTPGSAPATCRVVGGVVGDGPAIRAEGDWKVVGP